MRPEHTLIFSDASWFKPQHPDRASAAAQTLDDALPNEDGEMVIKTTPPRCQHILSLDDDQSAVLLLFSDFSCLLAKPVGPHYHLHPDPIRLKRTNEDAPFTLSYTAAPQKYRNGQLWITTPADTGKTYSTTVTPTTDPFFDDLATHSRAWLLANGWRRPITDWDAWDGEPLRGWQRPNRSFEQKAYAKYVFYQLTQAVIAQTGWTLPQATFEMGKMKEGVPTRPKFYLGGTTTPTDQDQRWYAVMNAAIDHPDFGPLHRFVSYAGKGRTGFRVLIQPIDLALCAHEHISVIRQCTHLATSALTTIQGPRL